MSKPIRFRASVSTIDNFLAPDLKDTLVTPGSILDLDADGRRDLKEMSLYRLCYLQRGYRLQFGQVIAPAPAGALSVPGQMPSSQLPSAPRLSYEPFPAIYPEEQD